MWECRCLLYHMAGVTGRLVPGPWTRQLNNFEALTSKPQFSRYLPHSFKKAALLQSSHIHLPASQEPVFPGFLPSVTTELDHEPTDKTHQLPKGRNLIWQASPNHGSPCGGSTTFPEQTTPKQSQSLVNSDSWHDRGYEKQALPLSWKQKPDARPLTPHIQQPWRGTLTFTVSWTWYFRTACPISLKLTCWNLNPQIDRVQNHWVDVRSRGT